MNLSVIMAVAAGGAVGSVLRYEFGNLIQRLFHPQFPFHTLGVNIIGSLMMGILVSLFALKWYPSNEMKAFLTVGLLGGFTTFSAFSLDVVLLFERADYGAAALYAMLSLILSVAALTAGMILIRSIT